LPELIDEAAKRAGAAETGKQGHQRHPAEAA
jgi:hypothetical protein